MPHSPHYRTKNFQHLLIKAGFRQAYLPYFLLSQNVKDHFINKDSIVFSSIKAEVKPDFAYAMSVQTECRTWKLVFESYAEVKPDFAIAKIQPKHPEIQIFSAPDIAPLFFQTPFLSP